MKELQIGQIITGRRANYVRPRIAALTLLTIAAAVSIRGMSTTTSAPGEHTNVVCGALGCSGNNPGHVKGTAHGAGGGTIRIGPTA